MCQFVTVSTRVLQLFKITLTTFISSGKNTTAALLLYIKTAFLSGTLGSSFLRFLSTFPPLPWLPKRASIPGKPCHTKAIWRILHLNAQISWYTACLFTVYIIQSINQPNNPQIPVTARPITGIFPLCATCFPD